MDEKVTSKEQKVTSNEQKVTSNEQKVTSNEQKVTSKKFNVSSDKTPRNFIDLVRAISRLFIFSFGKTTGISSFLLGLWKNEYLDFFTLSESLLEIHYSFIFCNSSFTLRKTVFISLFE